MPKTLTKTISFAEYLLLPYDGKRTEFVDGEIVEMAEASPLHADIIDCLIMLLKAYIAEHEQDQIVRRRRYRDRDPSRWAEKQC